MIVRSPTRIWFIALGGSLAAHVAALAAVALCAASNPPIAHLKPGGVEGVRITLIRHTIAAFDPAQERAREEQAMRAMRPMAMSQATTHAQARSRVDGEHAESPSRAAASIVPARLAMRRLAADPTTEKSGVDEVQRFAAQTIVVNDSIAPDAIDERTPAASSNAMAMMPAGESHASHPADAETLVQAFIASGSSAVGVDVQPVAGAGNRPPTYPAESRRRGEQGVVTLRIIVEADGCVSRLDIETSSGFDRLDASAAQAVRRWRFQPAQSGGSPTRCEIVLPIQFILRT